MPYRAFVAFSGGGAKGIVHVGALKALEDKQVEFAGLAGTSAGSIVATLAAAGFAADDLINPESHTTIIDRLRDINPNIRRASDIFGKSGWLRIRIFRAILGVKTPSWVLGAIAWFASATLLAISWILLGEWAWVWVLVGWTISCIVLLVAVRAFLGGLADVKDFRDALGTLIQQKMFPDEPERVVRMADFGREGRPSLKIVSANLNRRRLQLFSPERTPTIATADAVAASICLPVIFTPWVIANELHVDGGIVSNLPAWPFDEERELDPEALTIAVEIEHSGIDTPLNRYGWLPAALQTTLSGSAELNVRVAGPTEQLALPTKLNLLDFDVDVQTAAQEVRDVAAAATVRLDKRLFRRPALYRNACQVAQAIAQDALNIPPGGKGNQPRIRVAVGRLERGYVRSIRLSHSVGFEDDTDEFMLIPLDGSIAGAAWQDSQSLLEVAPFDPDRDMPGPAHRLRRKSRWRSSKWVMAIPILDMDGKTVRLLVQLDGSFRLEQNEETAAALQSVETAVKEFFGLVLSQLRELEDDDGFQKQDV